VKSLLPLAFCRSLLAGDGSLANTSNRLQAGSYSRSGIALSVLVSTLALTACTSAPKPVDYQPLVVRFFIEARPGEGGVPVHLPVSGVSVTVAAKPVLVEYDILNAEVAKVELGQCLMLQFTPAAARDLYRLSVASMGRRLVLTLNDEPVGARRIDQALGDGTLLVFVERPDAELPALVERIKRTSADIVAAGKK
jgi:hypothetical protein